MEYGGDHLDKWVAAMTKDCDARTSMFNESHHNRLKRRELQQRKARLDMLVAELVALSQYMHVNDIARLHRPTGDRARVKQIHKRHLLAAEMFESGKAVVEVVVAKQVSQSSKRTFLYVCYVYI